MATRSSVSFLSPFRRRSIISHRKLILPLTGFFLCGVLSVGVGLSPAVAQFEVAPYNAPTVVWGVFDQAQHMTDIDGDGDLDVVSRWRRNTRRVDVNSWRNDGDGTFTRVDQRPHTHEASSYNSPLWAPPMHEGDFNGDGLGDYVMAFPGETRIYVSDGVAPRSLFATLPAARSMTVADFDGDGISDVLTQDTDFDTGSSILSLYSGSGTGMSLDLQGSVPHLFFDEMLPVDLDGSGPLDFIFWSGPWVRLVTIQSGSFITDPDPYFKPDGSVSRGDIDGDGDEDLVFWDDADGNRLNILRNDDYSWNWITTQGGPATDLADVDGDGDLDGICCGGSSGGDRENVWDSTFMIALNDGNGGFDDSFSFKGLGSSRIAGATDLNGDGFVDLVAGRCIYFSNGPLSESPMPEISSSLLEPKAIHDLDQDGDTDFEFRLDLVRRNCGNGEVEDEAPEQTPAPPGSRFFGPGFPGDFDGDGFPDLIVEQRVAGVFQMMRLLRQVGGRLVDGGRAATPGERFTHRFRLDRSYFSIHTIGDLDSDGDLDLAMRPGLNDRHHVLWLNDGTGFFERGGEFVGEEVQVFGDVDGDEMVDLVMYTADGLKLRRGLGEALFSAPESLPSIDVRSLSLEDFDDDGDLDLLGFVTAEEPMIYRNDGSGSFTEFDPFPNSFHSAWRGNRILTTDVNGDGRTDLVVYPVGDTDLTTSLLMIRPETGFDYRHLHQVLDPSQSIDVDGDGDSDLVGTQIFANRCFDPPQTGTRHQIGRGTKGFGQARPVLSALGSLRVGEPWFFRVAGGTGGGRVYIGIDTGLSTAAATPRTPRNPFVVLERPVHFLSGILDGPVGEAGAGMVTLPMPTVSASAAGQTHRFRAWIRDDRIGGLTYTNGLEVTFGTNEASGH